MAQGVLRTMLKVGARKPQTARARHLLQRVLALSRILPEGGRCEAIDPRMIPAMRTDLVAGPVNVADERGDGAGDVPHHEEGRPDLGGREEIEQPAQSMPPCGRDKLSSARNSESPRRLQSGDVLPRRN